jgi:HAD superfamily hydrolase (TIGR01509 family)
VRALIFDVDGTLAETEELHRRAFNESFAAAGLPWVWDTVLYARLLAVTGGKERIRHYVDSHADHPPLSASAIARLHADKTARYAALVEQGGMALRSGVVRLLDEAALLGVHLAIATTTSRPNVDALLRVTLGRQPFEVIAAGDEVAAKKPAPDVYLLALARLGLDPGGCVALEDTLNGLRSAQLAGLPCLITRSLYGGDGPFPGALCVVDHLGDAACPAHVLDGPALSGTVVNIGQIGAWLVESAAQRAADAACGGIAGA